MKMIESKEQGFTLIEAMVVVALVAILATLGSTALGDMARNGQQTNANNSLLAAIRYTRSEAVKRRGTVTLCNSADQATCASSGGWNQGWIVFVDGDGDGTVDSGEAILKAIQPIGSDLTITGSGAAARRLTYTSLGFTSNAGTIRFCDGRGAKHATGIVVSLQGRPRQAADSNADGILEDGTGSNLDCS